MIADSSLDATRAWSARHAMCERPRLCHGVTVIQVKKFCANFAKQVVSRERSGGSSHAHYL
jgi:hypothetical protein